MDLQGKRAIITGASSGIGLAILKELLKNGCDVVACARNIDKIDISNEHLHLTKCDVSKKEELDALFEYAINTLGHIDLFIANAGFAYYEKIDKPDWDHIKSIYETNLMSNIYCAEKMKEHRVEEPYNFLVTASAMALLSMPGYALYSSSKAAVKGFGDVYRLELSKGQYYQVIYPIATKTKFFDRAGDGTPVPWPTQTPETVAKKVIRGIKHNKNNIHPSLTFRITSIVSRVFPFVFSIYVAVHNAKFKKWLEGK